MRRLCLLHVANRAVVRRTSALALVWLFLGALEVGAQLSIRVLDYNIHRDLGGTDSNVSAQPALAKVVNYLRPDVWTINELGGNSASFNASFARNDLISFIEDDLTIFGPNPNEGTDFFVYLGTFIDGFLTNAIVSRYPLLETQSFSDAGGGFAALRGLTSALLDLPGPTDLGVFTAHLKAFNGTADAERRQAEAEADSMHVAKWMDDHPGAAVVLSGDWNETEDAGQAANWSGRRIGDRLPGSGDLYHPITTMKSPGLLDAAPVSIRGDRDTISASNPTARFDYILYAPEYLSLSSGLVFDTRQYTNGELAALNSANRTNLVAADSAIASDHLPVLAVFMVVPEPSIFALFAMSVLIISARRQRDMPIRQRVGRPALCAP